jgi:hypothetical protein
MQNPARVRQDSEGSSESDPSVEVLRDDLIAYLAQRFEIPPELVLVRLGDWLLDPASEERRQHYARANYLRRGT